MHLLSAYQIFSHINGTSNQDNQAFDDILHIGVNPKEGQTNKNQTEQNHAKNNAADFARATHKGYTANHASSNRVKLIIQPRCGTI